MSGAEVPLEAREDASAFLDLLCASPLHSIRDRALTSLIRLAKDGQILRATLERCIGIQDLFITEGLLAAACGCILATLKADAVKAWVSTIREIVLPRLTSTNVRVLDYIDTIFAYEAHVLGTGYDQSWLRKAARRPWRVKQLKRERPGEPDFDVFCYPPFDYDFSHEYFDQLATDSDYKTVRSKSDLGKSMTTWLKGLGYDPAVFADLDASITSEAKEKHFAYGHETGTYCRKLSWLAYREVYGWLLLKGLKKPEQARFRFGESWLDPSMPRRPPKQQLFTPCLLAPEEEDIKEWVEAPLSGPVFERLLIRSEGKNPPRQWVLVHGRLQQSGRKKSRLYTQYELMLCPTNRKRKLFEDLKPISKLRTLEDRNIMAAEFPWRLTEMPDSDRPGRDPNYLRSVTSMYNWSVDHETSLAIPPVPIVHHIIANALTWRFVANGMYYVDENDENATLLYWDGTSSFLFIREDNLKRYCKERSLSPIWVEDTYKYGVLDGGKEFGGGARKDFRFSGVM